MFRGHLYRNDNGHSFTLFQGRSVCASSIYATFSLLFAKDEKVTELVKVKVRFEYLKVHFLTWIQGSALRETGDMR